MRFPVMPVRWIVRFLRNLLAVVGLAVIVVTTTPLTGTWTRWLTGKRWDAPLGDTLIVLSAEPPMTPGSLMGYSTYWRCVGAIHAWREAKFRRIVVTGADGAAQSMAGYLVAHGVPASSIVLEEKARSTVENARFTATLLPPATRGKVALLSSDFHMRRATAVFESAGFRDLAVLPQPDAGKRLLNPASRCQVAVDLAVETTKLLWYWVTGLA